VTGRKLQSSLKGENKVENDAAATDSQTLREQVSGSYVLISLTISFLCSTQSTNSGISILMKRKRVERQSQSTCRGGQWLAFE
jgi:hypothetical protein